MSEIQFCSDIVNNLVSSVINNEGNVAVESNVIDSNDSEKSFKSCDNKDDDSEKSFASCSPDAENKTAVENEADLRSNIVEESDDEDDIRPGSCREVASSDEDASSWDEKNEQWVYDDELISQSENGKTIPKIKISEENLRSCENDLKEIIEIHIHKESELCKDDGISEGIDLSNKVNISEKVKDKIFDKRKKDNSVDPSVIPTSGKFYMHDVRTDDASESTEKRNITSTKKDEGRWQHDLYDFHERTPPRNRDRTNYNTYPNKSNKHRGRRTNQRSYYNDYYYDNYYYYSGDPYYYNYQYYDSRNRPYDNQWDDERAAYDHYQITNELSYDRNCRSKSQISDRNAHNEENIGYSKNNNVHRKEENQHRYKALASRRNENINERRNGQMKDRGKEPMNDRRNETKNDRINETMNDQRNEQIHDFHHDTIVNRRKDQKDDRRNGPIYERRNESENDRKNEQKNDCRNEKVNDRRNERSYDRRNEPIFERRNEPIHDRRHEPMKDRRNEVVNERQTKLMNTDKYERNHQISSNYDKGDRRSVPNCDIINQNPQDNNIASRNFHPNDKMNKRINYEEMYNMNNARRDPPSHGGRVRYSQTLNETNLRCSPPANSRVHNYEEMRDWNHQRMKERNERNRNFNNIDPRSSIERNTFYRDSRINKSGNFDEEERPVANKYSGVKDFTNIKVTVDSANIGSVGSRQIKNVANSVDENRDSQIRPGKYRRDQCQWDVSHELADVIEEMPPLTEKEMNQIKQKPNKMHTVAPPPRFSRVGNNERSSVSRGHPMVPKRYSEMRVDDRSCTQPQLSMHQQQQQLSTNIDYFSTMQPMIVNLSPAMPPPPPSQHSPQQIIPLSSSVPFYLPQYFLPPSSTSPAPTQSRLNQYSEPFHPKSTQIQPNNSSQPPPSSTHQQLHHLHQPSSSSVTSTATNTTANPVRPVRGRI